MNIDGATILVAFGLGVILGVVGIRTWLRWLMDRDGHDYAGEPLETAVARWRAERGSR